MDSFNDTLATLVWTDHMNSRKVYKDFCFSGRDSKPASP